MRRESFERFYLTKVALGEGCGCAEHVTRIREIEVALAELNRAGETFLIVEHNVEFITNLCHRVIVLDQGKKLAEGTAKEIHTDARVLEAYLGMTPEMAEAEMRGAA